MARDRLGATRGERNKQEAVGVSEQVAGAPQRAAAGTDLRPGVGAGDEGLGTDRATLGPQPTRGHEATQVVRVLTAGAWEGQCGGAAGGSSWTAPIIDRRLCQLEGTALIQRGRFRLLGEERLD